MTAARTQRELRFTNAEFTQLSALAKSGYGLHLAANKKSLIYSRLARRVRDTGCQDFGEYLALVAPENSVERPHLVAAITTNVTQFFREAHHFEYLGTALKGPLGERLRNRGRVRIWSAGCSSGQEPFTMAAVILDSLQDAARLDIRILATDLSTRVLAQASSGAYTPEEYAGLTRDQQKMILKDGKVREDLRQLVTFRQLNLMADWPMARSFDVIFCRNVAIYFDKPTQETLWARFARQLAPGGQLMIGHSERISGPALTQLAPAGITTYRKTI